MFVHAAGHEFGHLLFSWQNKSTGLGMIYSNRVGHFFTPVGVLEKVVFL
jgi:hypothetical protein